MNYFYLEINNLTSKKNMIIKVYLQVDIYEKKNNLIKLLWTDIFLYSSKKMLVLYIDFLSSNISTINKFYKGIILHYTENQNQKINSLRNKKI